MPWHHTLVLLVDLDLPAQDMSSPSKFVGAAEKEPGVVEAFRTWGGHDAVVLVHGDSDRDNAATLKRIQGLPNVRKVMALLGYPGKPHGPKPDYAVGVQAQA